jgi:nucleoid-associated protein YgaU
LTIEQAFVYNKYRTNVLKRIETLCCRFDKRRSAAGSASGGRRMNRRYVLKNRRRFYTFIIVMTIALSCIFFAVTVNGADSGSAFTTVTVDKGDTLWDLAKEYNKGGDIRNYIREIEKVNNLVDGTIYEGDIIKMPI